MRTIIVLLVLVSLAGCADESKPQAAADKKPGKYTAILNQYQQTAFDTLHIKGWTGGESKYRFTGNAMDSTSIVLLNNGEVLETFEPESYFACYRFDMGQGRTGLITRTPGDYGPSLIRLYIYDSTADAITGNFLLADIWGDAGDATDTESWLMKDKQTSKWQSFRWIADSHDPTVEGDNPADTTIQESDTYQLYDLTRKEADTLSTDSITLVTKFAHLIKPFKVVKPQSQSATPIADTSSQAISQ